MDNPLVSVIVPTKNSSKTLERCLNSIKDQTFKNFEIIVVDNYSTDDTIEISKRFTDKTYVKGPERSAQVNYGVKKADGKYIYRVDSDFVLDSNLLEEAVNKCENKGFDAIIALVFADQSISFWAKVKYLERQTYDDDELHVAARFIRKRIFESIGGFDESLVAGEDYDLHNRLLRKKCKIGRITPREMHLGEPKSLWAVAKRSYFHGKTIGSLIKKNPEQSERL